MTIKFKFHKSPEATDDAFESAISCAKTCIESTLHENNPVSITCSNIISLDVQNITMQQCKDMVRGCFCNSSNQTYPEFELVEVFEA